MPLAPRVDAARRRRNRSRPGRGAPRAACRRRPRRRRRLPRRRTSPTCCATSRSRCASSATFPTTSPRRSCSSCCTPRTRAGVLRDATLMLQKEVADRLVARPGSDGLRRAGHPGGAARRRRADPDAAAGRVPAAAQGHVGGRPAALPAAGGRRRRSGRSSSGWSAGVFLQRRKTLRNALKPVADSLGRSAAELIERAGVDATKRPEALTLDDIARLARAVL